MNRRRFLQGTLGTAGAALAGCSAPEEPERPVELEAGYDALSGSPHNDLLNNIYTAVTIDEDAQSYTFNIHFYDTGLEFYQNCEKGWMVGMYEETENGEERVKEFARPGTPSAAESDVFEYWFFDEFQEVANDVHGFMLDHDDNAPNPVENYGINISTEDKYKIWEYGESAASYNLTVHGENGGRVTYHVPEGVVPHPDPFGDYTEPHEAERVLDQWSDILSTPKNIQCGTRERRSA